jgi:hypothetical protein
MKRLVALLLFCSLPFPLFSQDPSAWISSLPQAKDYVQHRVSSYDRSGGNGDARRIAPGETLTLLDEAGPGVISHVWVTIASEDPHHLKALVLRMYWDGETAPSVESPIGDFFGLGLGDYHLYQSAPLSVGSDKALNCFFSMPFQKHARITVSNEGAQRTDAFYFNIDYRAYTKPLAADSLYFHAQYRQATPARGWTNDWKSNGDAIVNDKKNLNGDGNYVWLETTGRGHFVGVTMSVLQNQDGWWGRRHVFCRWRGLAFDQWDWVGGLFSGSLGLWRARFFLRLIWGSCGGTGSGWGAVDAVSLSSGLADSVHEVFAGDD